MASKVWYEVVRSYLYVVIWMSISMSVIIFNKWLLAYSGFPYPIALTLWHMFFCSTVGFLSIRFFKITKSHGMSSHDYLRRVMPIGALYALSLWLSNSAYLYLSVSFIQMTKSLMPGLVYMCGLMAKTETYSATTVGLMTVIAVGVAVAAYGELNFVLKGVLQQLGALVFEAARLMLVQLLINSRGLNMNPIQSLYYVSPACFVCLSVPFFALELEDMRTNDEWKIYPSIFLANAGTAFLLNLAVFLLIGKTSALTMNIAGVIKDWMLIWLSGYLFHSQITALNLAGYMVAFLAVCVYNYTKFQAMKAKTEARAKDEPTADEESNAKA